MDYFVHVANVLYLFSYLVRDILWLRLLTVVAICCLMPYFYFQPTPLYAPIVWNVLFTAINGYQIWLLILERRPVKLSDEEQRLYKLAFRSLTPRELLKLLKIGAWRDMAQGNTLVEQGVHMDDVMVLFNGQADVQKDGNSLATLHPGQFVGEMSFLTGAKTSAAVVAKDPLRFVSWPQDALKKFLDTNPDLRGALQMVIGVDLVGKLKG